MTSDLTPFSRGNPNIPILTVDQREAACILREKAWSVERIGRVLGVSTTTAWQTTRHVIAPRQRKVRKATRAAS
jgi:hypothetical protein